MSFSYRRTYTYASYLYVCLFLLINRTNKIKFNMDIQHVSSSEIIIEFPLKTIEKFKSKCYPKSLFDMNNNGEDFCIFYASENQKRITYKHFKIPIKKAAFMIHHGYKSTDIITHKNIVNTCNNSNCINANHLKLMDKTRYNSVNRSNNNKKNAYESQYNTLFNREYTNNDNDNDNDNSNDNNLSEYGNFKNSGSANGKRKRLTTEECSSINSLLKKYKYNQNNIQLAMNESEIRDYCTAKGITYRSLQKIIKKNNNSLFSVP